MTYKPFLSTAAGILVLYVWVPDVRFSGEELLRLGGLAALACVYLSVVYTFGILVSANTALVDLLAFAASEPFGRLLTQ